MTEPPPPGYPPPPAGAFGAPPEGAYGAPPAGAYGAPPAGAYPYPPQMHLQGYVKYQRTPEERRGALACIVWPLAILSTCCAGLCIIGCIPLMLACESYIIST